MSAAAALFAGGAAVALFHLRSKRSAQIELKMALGTVQLGIEYGAANKTGMPTEEEAIAMICTAAERGIMSFDSARAYGLSEHRIGKALVSMPGHLRPKHLRHQHLLKLHRRLLLISPHPPPMWIPQTLPRPLSKGQYMSMYL